MDFTKYLRKSYVLENSKVYYGRFLRNGLHERYCYITLYYVILRYIMLYVILCYIGSKSR